MSFYAKFWYALSLCTLPISLWAHNEQNFCHLKFLSVAWLPLLLSKFDNPIKLEEMENMSFSTRKHNTKIGEEEGAGIVDENAEEQLFLEKKWKASRVS